jgi:hypothetical protein
MTMLAVGTFVSTAYAASITSITVNPSDPLVGTSAIVGVTTDGNATSYAWSYSCQADGCDGDVIPLRGSASSPSITVNLPNVGTNLLICDVTFTTVAMPPSSVTVPAGVPVHVEGPDMDDLISGPDTPTNACVPASVEFDFVMENGGDPIGALAAGTVEERIVKDDFDSGWSGEEAGEFTRQGNTIVDNKTSTPLGLCSDFMALPNGFVLDDFTQTNRFKAMDCCGQTVIFEFAPRHFQRVKTGPTTYTTIIVD